MSWFSSQVSEHRRSSQDEEVKRNAALPGSTVCPLHCERRRIALWLAALCIVLGACCLFEAGDIMTEVAGILVSPVYYRMCEADLKIPIIRFPFNRVEQNFCTPFPQIRQSQS